MQEHKTGTSRTKSVTVAALSLAFAVGAALAIAAGAARQDSPRQSLPATPPASQARLPVVQFTGHDSKVTREKFVLIRDEQAWENLWSEHTGRPVPQGPPTRHETPKIDFTRCMVVGHFTGPTTNQDGEVCEAFEVSAGKLRIRYRSSSFQTASFDGPDRGVPASAFGLWVIDRRDMPIVIEEGRIHSLQDTTVRWVEVKRFE